MSWVSATERLPDYDRWVIVSARSDISAFYGPAFRSHTNKRGENWSIQYDVANDSCALRIPVQWWYEIAESPPCPPT